MGRRLERRLDRVKNNKPKLSKMTPKKNRGANKSEQAVSSAQQKFKATGKNRTQRQAMKKAELARLLKEALEKNNKSSVTPSLQ